MTNDTSAKRTLPANTSWSAGAWVVVLVLLIGGWVSWSGAGEQARDTKVQRTYEGESKAGKIQDALDEALNKLDKDLNEGGVADALASWKVLDVTGKRGGFVGFRSVKVTISATRSPDWKK